MESIGVFRSAVKTKPEVSLDFEEGRHPIDAGILGPGTIKMNAHTFQAEDCSLVEDSWHVTQNGESGRGAYYIEAQGRPYMLKLERTKVVYRMEHGDYKQEFTTARQLYEQRLWVGDLMATWERPVGKVDFANGKNGVVFDFIEGNRGWNEPELLKTIFSTLQKREARLQTGATREYLKTYAVFLRSAAEYLHRLTQQNFTCDDNHYMYNVFYKLNEEDDALPFLTITAYDTEHYHGGGENDVVLDEPSDLCILQSMRPDTYKSAFGEELSDDQKILYQQFVAMYLGSIKQTLSSAT